MAGIGVSEASLAEAYRLMKAIMNTAVDDGIVFRNPCRVRGAAQDRSPERSVLTVREVGALVETIPERYRALVLLAVFGSLRWGELAALRRCDVDLTQGTVRVERSLTELGGGGYLYGPPKSAAGRRVVVVIQQLAAPATDVRLPNVGDSLVAEKRLKVTRQHVPVHLNRVRPQVRPLPDPRLGIIPEGHPARIWDSASDHRESRPRYGPATSPRPSW